MEIDKLTENHKRILELVYDSTLGKVYLDRQYYKIKTKTFEDISNPDYHELFKLKLLKYEDGPSRIELTFSGLWSLYLSKKLSGP
jgi:hypothetical protein